MVAVSPPSIQVKDGTEFEFDPTMTSKPLLDLKQSNRHRKANEILANDPMFVVPKDQLQGLPGLINNDLCTFDFFCHSVKPARNVKKDLKAFVKKRSAYTISNLHLPELDGKESKYRPLKHIEPVDNSASLSYTRAQAVIDKRSERNLDVAELDKMLMNIREILVTSNKKLTTITPDLIDQIYKFENLNDFTKTDDMEEILAE